MAKRLSDSRLHDLWRKACLIKAGNKCFICGRIYPDEGLECHHIVRRARKITRWMYENCSVLCHECHHKVHTQPRVKRDLENNFPYMDMLDELTVITYKDYLVLHGLTDTEYNCIIANRLKEIIKESE